MEVVNLTDPFGSHFLIVGDAVRIPVFQEIDDERDRQIIKWGDQTHPDGTGRNLSQVQADQFRMECEHATAHGFLTWRHILKEEVYEAFAETDPAKLRGELIQVAAVVVAWLQDMDRRSNG